MGGSAWRGPVRPGRRAFEWGLLLVVVLGLVLFFLQQAHQVQGQAELASIRSTLGALRMTAVQDDLRARVSGQGDRPVSAQSNPFELLQFRPGNYLGALDAAQSLTVRPGSWWFDPDCVCVVYAPLEPHWLVGASGAARLRFRVVQRAGPWELDALEPYVWQGQRVE